MCIVSRPHAHLLRLLLLRLSVIPVNALTSWLILGETLELVDVQGGLCITGGITLGAYGAPYTSNTYRAEELEQLLLAPASVALLTFVLGTLTALAMAVLCHEASKRRALGATEEATAASEKLLMPPPPTLLARAMPFFYPIVVGLLETIVQVAQKGGSSMAALTVAGDSQIGEPTFWGVLGVWVASSVLVVWWLRKGLANLAANRMLPIEYGAFTAASVLAGLVVYDEVQYVSVQHQLLMAYGVLLVVGGCALVGSRRAVRCSCAVRCTSNEEEREAASAAVGRLREQQLLQEHFGEHLLRSDDARTA